MAIKEKILDKEVKYLCSTPLGELSKVELIKLNWCLMSELGDYYRKYGELKNGENILAKISNEISITKSNNSF
ncbi:MAG: hypothetical protein AABY22_30175 [Nanoarchaeota archaeon]